MEIVKQNSIIDEKDIIIEDIDNDDTKQGILEMTNVTLVPALESSVICSSELIV